MMVVCIQDQGTFLTAFVESKEVKDSQYTKLGYGASKIARIKRIVVIDICLQGLSSSLDEVP
jgi:hypothetical protein